MKASNKFRATHTFAILSGDAHRIADIVKHYGSRLVSVSHQHVAKGSYEQARTYVVRLIDNRDLVDAEVYVDSLDNVIEKERVVVIAHRALGPDVKPDFSYQRSTLTAHTEAGRKWFDKNLQRDPGYNGYATFVDTDYIKGIERRIKFDGLSILIP